MCYYKHVHNSLCGSQDVKNAGVRLICAVDHMFNDSQYWADLFLMNETEH